MCGICGFTSIPDNTDPYELLVRMTDSIVHRGPDEDGVFHRDRIALGMRRLSIIDLDGGSQPIFNEDGSVCVVQNGEIYNYRELRSQLESRGHVFKSHCDTEVLVHLYEEYGVDFVDHINGMFAIAIWDIRRQRLVVVRDRLGVKPLYYSIVEGKHVVFGSEIKCLLQHPAVRTDLDHQAVYNYFTLGYIPAPRSVYRDIKKLPPASRLIVENGTIKTDQYWRLPEHVDYLTDREEAIEELRELLSDAVRLRMISDVPLGAFLSGGVDSSIVVALMAQQSSRPVKTFFIDFDDERFSERDYARAVATQYGTEHHELTVRPDAIGILDDVVDHFDEPFADSSAIPTWYVSKITREYVTVALAGDGGDESFGGYNRYERILNRQPRQRLRRAIRPLTDAVARLLPRRAPGKRYIRSIGLPNSEYYSVATAEHQARQLLSREFLSTVEHPVTTEVNGIVSDMESLHDPLAPYSRFDLRWYLPDDILTKVDRMSMAHSLEVRGPLLDFRVIELAARMPASWKINDVDRKLILKDAFRRDLPDKILKPRKRGFSVPMSDWIRGELRPFFESVLSSDDFGLPGVLDFREARILLDEHLSSVRDWSVELWRIAAFCRWHQRSVGKSGHLSVGIMA